MSYHQLAKFTAVIALCVIVLGAYVRLSHAGLGCPDWPGCYGQLTWPSAAAEVAQAELAYPERPVSSEKAWKEMVHRYLAGTLGLLIAALAVIAWLRRKQPGHPLGLSLWMVVIVLFQAALGAWTVTLKLKPLIVMGHLVFGFTTLALLVWAVLASRGQSDQQSGRRAGSGVFVGALLALSLQVMLGGWVSSNYSAVSCPDFPQCQGQWWPDMNFVEAFKPWRGIGVDYEGGVLDLPSRTAIHVAHRIGAIVASIFILLAAWMALRHAAFRASGMLLIVLLAIQITLGITNVLAGLPIAVAAAHNGVAALLVATLVWLIYRTRLTP